MQNENIIPIKKSIKNFKTGTSKILNAVQVPSEHRYLCGCTGHTPIKLTLLSWELLFPFPLIFMNEEFFFAVSL